MAYRLVVNNLGHKGAECLHVMGPGSGLRQRMEERGVVAGHKGAKETKAGVAQPLSKCVVEILSMGWMREWEKGEGGGCTKSATSQKAETKKRIKKKIGSEDNGAKDTLHFHRQGRHSIEVGNTSNR